ncbi:hypothetical protein [Nitrosopumilus piranensis]|uniref:Uncharacterized protein n=1 Tax=Nitrosopumilus piranensis TaxID=1582439 RepID=A0A0C5BTV5_9ARCH|nr:hypothetical protein [Nitrosopumilus piranensis]AJM91716.1 hypothetical protein NPIRD3C_0502 [Nitrosopumilus piranensis]
MNNALQIECFSLHLRDYSQAEIAKKLNIDQSTVSRALNKVKKSSEYELGTVSITTFLDTFKKAEQYWKESNKEYRELIEQLQQLPDESDLDGNGERLHKSKYDKTVGKVDLISKLKQQQDKNMERILTLAQQGEVVLALKTARNIISKHVPQEPIILE